MSAQEHNSAVGTYWVWEVDQPHARELIEVVEVKWNGEEWWVATKALLRNPTYPPTGRDVEWNDLGRFWEAITPVGGNAEREKGDQARKLLLEIEGAILGYWTDLPQNVLEDFRVRIRDVLGAWEPA